MKLLMFLSLAMTLNAFALVKCGSGGQEKYYPQYKWVKISNTAVDSSFAKTAGIICVAFNKDQPGVFERFSFRDSDGNSFNTTTRILRQGETMMDSEDLPSIASSFIKEGDLLTVKLLESKFNSVTGETEYKLALRMLYNLGGGGSRKYRELILRTKVSKDYTVKNYTTSGKIFTKLKFYVTTNIFTMKVLLNSVTFLNIRGHKVEKKAIVGLPVVYQLH